MINFLLGGLINLQDDYLFVIHGSVLSSVACIFYWAFILNMDIFNLVGRVLIICISM